MFAFLFFKQKTAYEMRISDWSSDVCSSDLSRMVAPGGNPSTCSRWRAADCNACAEDELARPSARASASAVFQAGARIDANGWPARTGSYGALTNKRSTTASTRERKSGV